MIFTSVEEVTKDNSKFKDFLDISNVIIDYHNQYGEIYENANFNDFLMIIPVNFSTMVSGFLCGLENETNASTVRITRHVLSEYGLKVMSDLKKINPVHD